MESPSGLRSIREFFWNLGNGFPLFSFPSCKKGGSSRSILRFPETPSTHFQTTVTMPPCVIDESIVRFDGSFGGIEIPGFHPEGKQKCVGILAASCRGGSLANQAWQRRLFSFNENGQKLEQSRWLGKNSNHHRSY